MPKSRKKKQDSTSLTPPPVQQTQLLLENMTDYAGFQRICDELLSAHFGYKVNPRGLSVHGKVKGQPDSWGRTPDGRLCALAYGTSPQWKAKLQEDLRKVHEFVQENPSSLQPQVFVFCTNQHIDSDNEQALAKHVEANYGWELHLIGSAALAIPLDTEWQDIRYRYFGIRVEHHNWRSLLNACAIQRQKTFTFYEGKYDPTLYIPHPVEKDIEIWYRHAANALAEGKEVKQLLVIADQAGAGKSSLVLHLAALFGKRGPVIILRGTITINDDSDLERMIIEAVKDADDKRTYHSDLTALCHLAQHNGQPILVILVQPRRNFPEVYRDAAGPL